MSMFDSEVQERPTEAWLSLDSDFGAAKDDAKDLLAHKYGARGLAFDVDRYSSTLQSDDIVCTARENGFIVGTMTVRFDREQPLNADQIFSAELNQWRRAGVKLCEFGRLAVDRRALEPKQLLARIFHLGYLHAHRREGFDRLVIEVNPRHVAFYRRWLGLLPHTTPRHNPSVNAPAVLMSLHFQHVRSQIARWGGQPSAMASARSLYPLAWGPAEEAAMLARLD
jgi:hypothetical protein